MKIIYTSLSYHYITNHSETWQLTVVNAGSDIASEGHESGCSAPMVCPEVALESVGRDCGHLKGLERSSRSLT